MRFEPSPLSLSISLQALAVSGERKHFGVFQSGSVYCKSLRGMVDGGCEEEIQSVGVVQGVEPTAQNSSIKA